MPVRISLLGSEQAIDYRAIRLRALEHEPDAFGTLHADERAQPLAMFEDRLRAQSFFGAYDSDAIVGLVGFDRDVGAKLAHKGLIRSFFVDRAVRGRGIGRVLLDTALRHADAVVEQVRLTVVTGNVPAIALYESVGFARYGIEKRALKNALGFADELLMVRFGSLSHAPPWPPHPAGR